MHSLPRDTNNETDQDGLMHVYASFAKVSEYNYHLLYVHGISPTTGLPFSPPIDFRTTPRKTKRPDERIAMREGKCRTSDSLSCESFVRSNVHLPSDKFGDQELSVGPGAYRFVLGLDSAPGRQVDQRPDPRDLLVEARQALPQELPYSRRRRLCERLSRLNFPLLLAFHSFLFASSRNVYGTRID